MSVRTDYVAFGGGLDFVSSSVAAKPGRLADVLNFERVFGRHGYKRIDGYERFDGHDSPHQARYWSLSFAQGSQEITAGQMIFGSTAQCEVLQVTVTRGSWGAGDAAGELTLLHVQGAWVSGQDIRVGSSLGPVAARTTSALQDALEQDPIKHKTFLRQAQQRRRQLIQPVPGEGPVLGVAVFLGQVVAFRNAVGSKTAAMWRATESGWKLVRAGLLPSGRYDFAVANFAGDAAKSMLCGVDGRNPLFSWDGVTFRQAAPIFGTEGTSLTPVTIGTGEIAFMVEGTARSWRVGDALVAYTESGETLSGVVVSYSHPHLRLRVEATSGTGRFSKWRICQADFEDAPKLLAAHKTHMFLAYPRGQLQASNLGDPMTYTTSAALMGVGDEINGLTSLKGSVLGIFCANKVHLLEGSSRQDWNLSLHARNVGTLPGTLQENAGNAVMLSGRGLVSLQATQTFGGFEPATWSQNVTPWLSENMQAAVACRMVRGKYQYRLYFADGTVLAACIATPNAVIAPGDVEFTFSRYQHVASCVTEGEMQHGQTCMFFGTQDGWVMHEDVGTSFDGAPIHAYARLHFDNLRSPTQRKRFHKLTLEMDAPGRVDIRFLQLFDLADNYYPRSATQLLQTQGTGGQWDLSRWNRFYWSSPAATQAEVNVSGIGRNMGLLLWMQSDMDEPVLLQGLLIQYAILGMTR